VILWSFGTFSPVLVHCVKKNLAALVPAEMEVHRHRDLVLCAAVMVGFPLGAAKKWFVLLSEGHP
jgi:hypothetical protein